ncbi:hypothetical protein LO772_17420 [Yinghuangia sp. ASG 101]|uniref:hypothetical protein n=1 Tax=Yinghuangia sp. ASG 101 TaxID=2896848 RepID=UPI001E51AE47|nr:hypothetical protein [Yinghuangia sp. ASG 101]UGQ15190.1 hypothetical protein LO772_17420 [Yinghuangia sp. ASG 101]
MNEFAHDRGAPEVGTGPAAGETRRVRRPAEHSDALEWRERDRERARLLLERAGDIARRMERACGHLTEGSLSLGLPAGGHGSP